MSGPTTLNKFLIAIRSQPEIDTTNSQKYFRIIRPQNEAFKELLKDNDGRTYVIVNDNKYYTDTYYYGFSGGIIVDKETGKLCYIPNNHYYEN